MPQQVDLLPLITEYWKLNEEELIAVIQAHEEFFDNPILIGGDRAYLAMYLCATIYYAKNGAEHGLTKVLDNMLTNICLWVSRFRDGEV